MDECLRDSAAPLQLWRPCRTYNRAHSNSQHSSPKQILGRGSVPKNVLGETELKGTFAPREPGVGRRVQGHEHPTLLHGVCVHSLARERA